MPADVAITVEQRIVEAAAVLPAYGGVTGWAALRWLGGVWFDGSRSGREVKPVLLGPGDSSIRPQPGFEISEERIAPGQLVVHRGLVVTSAVYSLSVEMRHALSADDATVAADMAAYSDLVSSSELRDFVGANPGWTGVQRSRDGAADMSENAWSPMEVRMRQVWCSAGFPRPMCNRPVSDLSGHFIGTPDLVDAIAGVAGEYDGSLHLDGAQRARDVHREGLFRAAGLEYVTMLAGDVAEPWAFLARLRQAYARAARVPLDQRRWTLELPGWWVPTFTVDQRRALSEDQRLRWLNLRRRVG